MRGDGAEVRLGPDPAHNPATALPLVRIFVRVGNQNDRDAFADILRRVGLELLRPETVHPTGAPSHSNLEAEIATPEHTLDDVPRRLKFERAA